MRQVMRANKNIAARDRHVFGQLPLDREVTLIRVGVLKVLLHVQREGKYWTKARERLIVQALATELILRANRDARSHNPCRTDRRHWSTRRTNSSLKYLHRIQQRRLRRAARRQDALLLLHGIGDVGVECDRE